MYYPRYLICLVLVFLMGCGSKSIFHAEAPKSYRLQSSQYYNFLVGELAFKNEDLKRSYSYYQSFAANTKKEEASSHLLRLLELALVNQNVSEAINLLEQKIAVNSELIDYILLNNLYLINDQQSKIQPNFEAGVKQFAESKELLIAKFYTDNYEVTESEELEQALKNITDSDVKNFLLPLLANSYFLNEDLPNAKATYLQCLSLPDECNTLEDEYLEFLIRTKDFTGLQEYLKDSTNESRKHIFVKQYLSSELDGQVSFERIESVLGNTELDSQETLRDYHFKFLSSLVGQQDLTYSILSLQIFALLYPDFPPVKFYLATFYKNLKKYDLAVSEFLSIPKDSSQYLQSRIGAVSILQETKKYSAATVILEEILNVPENQSNINLWLLHIKLLHDQRKFEKLLDLLPELLIQFPNDELLLFEYAVVLQEENQDQKCLEILDQILIINPQNHQVLNFIAYVYADAGVNLELAHQYVDQALNFDPQSPYYIDTKAWIYYKQKQFPIALKTMDRAMTFLPDDPILLEHYGDILSGLDKKEEAQQYFRKSLLMANESDLSNEIRKLKIRLKAKLEKKEN